jgi:hypothetical protein
VTSKPFTSPAICEGKGGRIEARDSSDARSAIDDVAPALVHADSDGRDDAKTGDDDAAARHGECLKRSEGTAPYQGGHCRGAKAAALGCYFLTWEPT